MVKKERLYKLPELFDYKDNMHFSTTIFLQTLLIFSRTIEKYMFYHQAETSPIVTKMEVQFVARTGKPTQTNVKLAKSE